MTTDDRDCDRLADAAVAGDQVALNQLLALVRPKILRYCRARIGAARGTYATADDVAQETLLALLTALPRYRASGAGFLAFAYGVAAHKVADYFRHQRRHATQQLSEQPEPVDVRPGPEQRAVSGDLTRRLNAMLDRLTPEHREIVTLRIVVGLSSKETADALSSTPGAVRVAQHRALGKLRQYLKGGGEGYGRL